MSILEFDMEHDMKCIRRDEREIGRAEGIAQFRTEIATSFILEHLQDDSSVEAISESIVKLFRFPQDEAIQLVSKLKGECTNV